MCQASHKLLRCISLGGEAPTLLWAPAGHGLGVGGGVGSLETHHITQTLQCLLGEAGSEEVPKRAQEGRGAKAKVVMGIRASRLLPSAPGRLAWWSLSAIYWRVASLTLSDFICTVGTRAVPFHQALCQYGSCVRVPESPPAPPGTWSEMRTLQPNQGGPVAR